MIVKKYIAHFELAMVDCNCLACTAFKRHLHDAARYVSNLMGDRILIEL